MSDLTFETELERELFEALQALLNEIDRTNHLNWQLDVAETAAIEIFTKAQETRS